MLLSIEGITVALIIIVAAVVLIKVLGGEHAGDQDFTLSVFDPPSGVGATRSRSALVLRLPLVRRLRGRGLARRGDEEPAP